MALASSGLIGAKPLGLAALGLIPTERPRTQSGYCSPLQPERYRQERFALRGLGPWMVLAGHP